MIPFDFKKLRQRSKILLYAYLYSGYEYIQTLIDEEGCGAVFGEFVDA